MPEDQPLTQAQIENWRRVLLGMFGLVALIMPAAEIQAYRDNIQRIADSEQGANPQ